MRMIETGEADFDVRAKGSRSWLVRIGSEDDGPCMRVLTAGDGDGPTVMVCGGMHGDEFEGQLAALELARALPGLTIRGRLIVLPLLNEAASRASSRVSPQDGRDLNRQFERAAPATTPSEAMASFVEARLLPSIDYLVDIHSGGAPADWVLSSNLASTPGTSEYDRMLPSLLAFDAPYAIVFGEAGGLGMPHRSTMEGAARTMGKGAISSELGGLARATAASLSVTRKGLRNVLHHFGVVRSADATHWRDSRSALLDLSEPDQHLIAEAPGWFAPAVSLGDSVAAGDVVGHMIDDVDPLAAPSAILAKRAGIVVSLSRTRRRAGEKTAYIAEPLPRP